MKRILTRLLISFTVAAALAASISKSTWGYYIYPPDILSSAQSPKFESVIGCWTAEITTLKNQNSIENYKSQDPSGKLVRGEFPLLANLKPSKMSDDLPSIVRDRIDTVFVECENYMNSRPHDGNFGHWSFAWIFHVKLQDGSEVLFMQLARKVEYPHMFIRVQALSPVSDKKFESRFISYFYDRGGDGGLYRFFPTLIWVGSIVFITWNLLAMFKRQSVM